MKKQLVITMVVFICAAAGFYLGMRYQQNKSPLLGNNRFPLNNSQGGMRYRNSNNPAGMQPLSGEITSADDTGITVKMPDGSSKIIIISNSTKIVKTSETDKSALIVGELVTAFGTANTDGSVTAQNISLGNFMFRRLDATSSAAPALNNDKNVK